MEGYRVLAHLEDLAPGEVLGVELDGVEIALARASDGSVHALGDICTHDRVNLSDGDLDEDRLECWKHGSQFDLVTGQPQQLPATKPVPVYPVHIDQATGAISVSLGPHHTS
ncbi:MAG: non-heme iron oxygenase ferredoxin subunit [Dermabacter sp.]|nr:non-heme iron oxygenase ferredoxin subunit [Dermabacter sp.]